MTVYVVYRNYDYEGCSEPLVAFSTYAKAEAYVETNRNSRYEAWEIEVLEVDTDAN